MAPQIVMLASAVASAALSRAVSYESAALIFALGVAVALVLRTIQARDVRRTVEQTGQKIQETLRYEVLRANGTPLAFLDNSPAPSWYKDRGLVMKYLNPAYTQAFGVTQPQYLGRTDDDVWPPQIARQFVQHDREVLATGRRYEYLEWVPTDRTTDIGPPETGQPREDGQWWTVVRFPVLDRITGEVMGVGGQAWPYVRAIDAASAHR